MEPGPITPAGRRWHIVNIHHCLENSRIRCDSACGTQHMATVIRLFHRIVVFTDSFPPMPRRHGGFFTTTPPAAEANRSVVDYCARVGVTASDGRPLPTCSASHDISGFSSVNVTHLSLELTTTSYLTMYVKNNTYFHFRLARREALPAFSRGERE